MQNSWTVVPGWGFNASTCCCCYGWNHMYQSVSACHFGRYCLHTNVNKMATGLPLISYSFGVTSTHIWCVFRSRFLTGCSPKCKGCLINNQTLHTAQHDNQVIWHMPRSYWDSHPTVSWVYYTTSVAVLWLPVKPLCDCFLYICLHSEEVIFLYIFHQPEHMKVTGEKDWTEGGMWKNFPLKLLQLLMCGSCRVWSGTVMEENDSMW